MLRIGTRGSPLAMRQTQLVIAALRGCAPEIRCQVVVIRTRGDEASDDDRNQLEGQGIFVRRIEESLLAGAIDLAVHSFKDLPSRTAGGLALAALPSREDPRDVLVSRENLLLDELPVGARIGTGSPRRRALLRDFRPDLEVTPIRGNVDTRLQRAAMDLDAVVLAAAGLSRLDRSDAVTQFLDPIVFVPAVGQGILAIQVREHDEGMAALVAPLDDAATQACSMAERAVAVAVNASCDLPFGAYARVSDGDLTLDAFLAHEDGAPLVRLRTQGPVARAEQLGAEVGVRLRGEL
jgi:hydroxymethylbilane synthase